MQLKPELMYGDGSRGRPHYPDVVHIKKPTRADVLVGAVKKALASVGS